MSLNFLLSEKIWCHAKTTIALSALHEIGAHYFWHQEDDYTLTSKNFVWVYPGKKLLKNSILVMPEWDMEVSKIKLDKEIFGVCSDYVLELRESNS